LGAPWRIGEIFSSRILFLTLGGEEPKLAKSEPVGSSTSGDGFPLNQHRMYLIVEGCDGAGQSKELIPDTALVKSYGCLILRFDPGTWYWNASYLPSSDSEFWLWLAFR